jgi:hypothetical protein
MLSRWPPAASAPATAEIARLIEGLGDTIPASLTHESSRTTTSCFAMAPGRHRLGGSGHRASVLRAREHLPGPGRPLGLRGGAPDLLALRDAYLEPWTIFAPRSRLIELFELAYPLGMLCRALSWDRLLAEVPVQDRGEFDHFVPAWLEMASETLEGQARLGS